MGFMTSRVGSMFGSNDIWQEKTTRMRAHASASPVACAAAMLAVPSVIFWEYGEGSLLVFWQEVSNSARKSQNKQSTGADLRTEPGAGDDADGRMRQIFICTAADSPLTPRFTGQTCQMIFSFFFFFFNVLLEPFEGNKKRFW